MSQTQPPRTSSYQRLVEKLKRNPSERFDPADWPRPKNYSQVLDHALKGGTSKMSFMIS